jgi:predicted DNA-binding transcriptional regulator AlpA
MLILANLQVMSTNTIYSTWISVNEATQVLGISRQTIYNQIKESINFPHRSPFKAGVSWRKVSAKRIQINIARWEEQLKNL